jgi:hypothetical protein
VVKGSLLASSGVNHGFDLRSVSLPEIEPMIYSTGREQATLYHNSVSLPEIEPMIYSTGREQATLVKGSLLASSGVNHGFDLRSGKSKDYKISMCCFSTKHIGLSSKIKG